VLAERDVMTTAQLEEWKRKRGVEEEAFMSDAHLLRCSCGHNTKASIPDACDQDWFVRTRDLQVLEARCPACSRPRLKELSRDINRHLTKN
jgi:hypothetical protein